MLMLCFWSTALVTTKALIPFILFKDNYFDSILLFAISVFSYLNVSFLEANTDYLTSLNLCTNLFFRVRNQTEGLCKLDKCSTTELRPDHFITIEPSFSPVLPFYFIFLSVSSWDNYFYSSSSISVSLIRYIVDIFLLYPYYSSQIYDPTLQCSRQFLYFNFLDLHQYYFFLLGVISSLGFQNTTLT